MAISTSHDPFHNELSGLVQALLRLTTQIFRVFPGLLFDLPGLLRRALFGLLQQLFFLLLPLLLHPGKGPLTVLPGLLHQLPGLGLPVGQQLPGLLLCLLDLLHCLQCHAFTFFPRSSGRLYAAADRIIFF